MPSSRGVHKPSSRGVHKPWVLLGPLISFGMCWKLMVCAGQLHYIETATQHKPCASNIPREIEISGVMSLECIGSDGFLR